MVAAAAVAAVAAAAVAAVTEPWLPLLHVCCCVCLSLRVCACSCAFVPVPVPVPVSPLAPALVDHAPAPVAAVCQLHSEVHRACLARRIELVEIADADDGLLLAPCVHPIAFDIA